MMWSVTGKNFGSYYIENGIDCVIFGSVAIHVVAWNRQRWGLAKRTLENFFKEKLLEIQW